MFVMKGNYFWLMPVKRFTDEAEIVGPFRNCNIYALKYEEQRADEL